MKLVKTLLAVSAAAFLMAGKAKVPTTEKECGTAKNKKAGWVWENGACSNKKEHSAEAPAHAAGEKKEGETAAPEEVAK